MDGVKLSYIEFYGGVFFPEVIFENNKYSGLEADRFLSQSGGFAYRMQFHQYFSLVSAIDYSKMGVHFDANHNYRFISNYFSLMSGMEMEVPMFKIPGRDTPLFILSLSPYAGLRDGTVAGSDVIHYRFNTDDLNLLDFGFQAVGGVRIPIFYHNSRFNLNLKAAYMHGLRNMSSLRAPDFTEWQKDRIMFIEDGSMKNRGLKFLMSIEVSLDWWNMTHFTAGGKDRKLYDRYVRVNNRSKLQNK